jgi:osmotically-inducible protein OsmY
LAQDSELDASEIEVKVHNGVVTLTGTVSERQFKRMAEDLAERCYGVKDVRNEIRTGRDSEITAEKSRSTGKSQ